MQVREGEACGTLSVYSPLCHPNMDLYIYRSTYIVQPILYHVHYFTRERLHLGGDAAVNSVVRAGAERGLVGREVEDERRHLCGLPHPPNRLVLR